jgi:predicted RNA binding protein YcfA (HicA-like mRNA interferase family)
MTRLPVASGRDCVRVLELAGFEVKRQTGSHIILRRDSPFCQVTVPDHRTLDRGTLRAIIRQSGLTIEEFVGFLKELIPTAE